MSNVFNQGRLKPQVEDKVVGRILELHLRGVELFDKLGDKEYADMVAELRRRLANKAANYKFLQESKHDQVVFSENERPDGFYIIRLGMVKIVKNASPLLGRSDIADWSSFETRLRAGATEADGPLRGLAQKLPAGLWDNLDAARKQAAAETAWFPEQQEVLYAINDLLKLKNFHELVQFKFDPKNPLHVLMQEEAKTLKEGKLLEDIVRLRGFNRRLLELLFGDTLRVFGATPPVTLSIRSSRDWVFAANDPETTKAESSLIGEMGLFENRPRSATCVAYGHPEATKFGETHLYFIPKDLFDDLLDPKHIAEVIARRKEAERTRLSLSVWQESANARRFEELGLMQGQKLMLIDLDRCTRCDKCVEACIVSHSPPGFVGAALEKLLPSWLLDWTPFSNRGPRDGRSRLFLDGPRIQIHEGDRTRSYLVPATCRQCKDPVCLINCPVGSIHKGDNGQIVIENWCIGCNGCAEKCPYNAIQMHAVGVIPRGSHGWRHWQEPGEVEVGATPFRDTPDFRSRYQPGKPITFAYTFDLTREQAEKSKTLMLHIESSALDLQVAVNKTPLTPPRERKEESNRDIAWNWKAILTLAGAPAPAMVPGEEDMMPQPCLQVGTNEIVIQCSLPPAKTADVLLDVGLTGYVPPVVESSVAGEEYKQEWVMKQAAVCDMCSGQVSQQPACVTACPHEAAERKYITYDSFLPARS
jgi:Fe-S-cluster-containing dehydrogenase component